MKIEKRIELCDACGLGYYKPFYEPLWLSKILWKSSHGKRHAEWENGNEVNEVADLWKQQGADAERERIIKLLEGFDDSCLWRQVEWSPDAYEGFNMQDLIALIKGENK